MFNQLRRLRISEEQVKSYHENMIAARKEAERYRAMLFNAWQTMAGQTRGLQRQRRLIKRLQAENARLTDRQMILPPNGDMP
jgi:hypothetical protein